MLLVFFSVLLCYHSVRKFIKLSSVNYIIKIMAHGYLKYFLMETRIFFSSSEHYSCKIWYENYINFIAHFKVVWSDKNWMRKEKNFMWTPKKKKNCCFSNPWAMNITFVRLAQMDSVIKFDWKINKITIIRIKIDLLRNNIHCLNISNLIPASSEVIQINSQK